MKKVIGLGDLLVSFSPPGYQRIIQANSFDISYTGAEANVCVSLSCFGIPASYVTRLPDNAVGKAAAAMLNKFGVSTEYICYGGSRIGLLYLEKGASQRPSRVIYDRSGSAICEAGSGFFDWDSIYQDAQWLHFTGITPALSSTTPELCLEACRKAKEYGLTVSCDLNYRKKLWSTQRARQVMEKLLPYVDVLIANEEDAEKVLGLKPGGTNVDTGILNIEGYMDVAEQISRNYHIPYIATTLRKSISASDNQWSALLYHDGKTFLSKEYRIHIVNRVGGGDSFAAGLIYGLLQQFEDQKTIEFAAAASCLKHSIEYDYNLVTAEEVMELVNGSGSGRVQR